MKFKIFKSKKTEKKKSEQKNIIELILFVFSMCAITMLLIFGAFENQNEYKKLTDDTPVFEENGLYNIFNLDLLKNTKTVDSVSVFFEKTI